MIDNLDKFYISREEAFIFFRDYTTITFDSSYQAKQDETKGTGLKILTSKQMLFFSLYQSKQITKKYTITQ